ncbi:hypothetical protein [Frondihabitans peucedani]|uniref:Asp23/Gls24 family envelope stress response protein n=1 Tax=Frondihabitans peucedani TaxID=598626 RepID=A0ABP8E1Z6_9MICO
MTDDVELSRALTAAVRATPGVAGVYPAQPVLEAAATVLAAKLALRQPDVLVDIDRTDGFTSVSVQIATHAAEAAPDTVRRVGETVRDLCVEHGEDAAALTVAVTVRLVEG